jgi:soluble lytic murein transglycosylase-like protein
VTTPRRSSPRVRSRRALAAFAALLAFAAPAAADIFHYVDADGVMHFTNRPAGDGRYRLYMKSRDGARRSAIGSFAPSDTSPERFNRYDEAIHQAATLYQIPEELVRAVIKVESDYDARAVSTAGAQGLMQLMPETAQRMQVRDPFDPRENIFGGVRYLRILANTFNGDLHLTIAGYNAGEGAIMRYGGIPPYEETQDYVVKVMTYYNRLRAQAPPAAQAPVVP